MASLALTQIILCTVAFNCKLLAGVPIAVVMVIPTADDSKSHHSVLPCKETRVRLSLSLGPQLWPSVPMEGVMASCSAIALLSQIPGRPLEPKLRKHLASQ